MELNRLSAAIAAYRSDPSDENLGVLYMELCAASYVVPVIFEGDYNDTYVRSDTKVNLFTMKNTQNEKYYLVFSSINNFNSWQADVHKDTISLTFKDLVLLLGRSPHVSGILIDPHEGNMVFDKELMQMLYDISEKPDQNAQA